MVKVGYCKGCPNFRGLGKYPESYRYYCKHPNIEKERGKKRVSIYDLLRCPKNSKVELKTDWKKNG